MNTARFKITLKVVLGYLTLILIGITSAWYLYTEIDRYFTTRSQIHDAQNRLFNLSGVLSQLYENESFARLSVRMENEDGFTLLLKKNDSLKQKLLEVKSELNFPQNQEKIDSILFLLQKKGKNYLALRAIYSDNQRTEYLNSALYKLSEIETAFGKVTVEDFSQNPDKLSNREKALMNEIVQLLNKNRPPSETRKLNEQTLDSIVVATKLLLNRVKTDAATQQRIILQTENALWENDSDISRQIREIFQSLEKDRIKNFTALQAQSTRILDKNWKTLLFFGSLGLILALLFSFFILQDFFKNQKLRKALEEARARAETLLQRREQLLATVSHDLRSPLSNLLGYKQLLEKSDLNDKQKYYLDHIDKSADYVHRLANDLLNFSLLEKNKILLDERPFSIRDLMEEVTAACRQMLEEKAVKMQLHLGETLPKYVAGDPLRIKQILMNIAGNACKFTDTGTVELRAELTQKNRKFAKVCFSFIDSGPGMDKEALQQMFNEFTQAHGIGKKYGGAGLGLAIAKRLTELMNGEIKVESQVGKGSTFRVYLPLKWAPSGWEEHSKTIIKKSSKPLQVMVWVDDDSAHLQLVAEWLKDKPVVFHTFNRSADALPFLEKNKCDLLVTDLEMPKINGYELARKAKSLNQNSELPVVAVSGIDEQTVKDSGGEVFETFIQKPLSPEKLDQLLAYYFGNCESDKIPSPQARLPIPLKNSNFNLTRTAEFLNHDPQALCDFLEVFIKENRKNTNQLKAFLSEKNLPQAAKIAHKMLPLYRQLEAEKLIEPMEKLERNTQSDEKIEQLFSQNLILLLENFGLALQMKYEALISISTPHKKD